MGCGFGTGRDRPELAEAQQDTQQIGGVVSGENDASIGEVRGEVAAGVCALRVHLTSRNRGPGGNGVRRLVGTR
jgi:hypothetical protein